MPWAGSRPAHYYLKTRRERIQANMTKVPTDAVHGLLRVQPAVELPRTIDEVMKRAPKPKRAGRLKPPAGSVTECAEKVS
jgi:hypothetical protein